MPSIKIAVHVTVEHKSPQELPRDRFSTWKKIGTGAITVASLAGMLYRVTPVVVDFISNLPF